MSDPSPTLHRRASMAEEEDDIEDMILMNNLTNTAILDNLSRRYHKDNIYTWIGSVLVALNPLRPLPIYGPGMADRYPPELSANRPPPHIFGVAAAALSDVRRTGRPQCILVTGESGSGKTESGKFALRHLVTCADLDSVLEQRILAADPVLEAFGNARTTRNNNSSRFGKLLDVDVTPGRRGGAQVDHFLLERSRVVRHADGERNFHVFYRLLAGLDARGRESRQLTTDPADFLYTCQTPVIDDEDRTGFQQLYSALVSLAFSPEEIAFLWSCLAAVLHLGNVEFRADARTEKSSPTAAGQRHLQAACDLLGVSSVQLGASLASRRRWARQEVLISPVSAQAANEARDALAKALYRQVFEWTIAHINASVGGPPAERQISILDIFGFENMSRNSFEQLCINVANEHLHQFFLSAVFKLEQAEYAKEGVTWTLLGFTDNEEVLDLLAGPSVSVLALLDDEALLAAGSDGSLLRQLHAARQGHPSYSRPRSDVDLRFMVSHFAGTVVYEAEGMVEKNRDELSVAMVELLGTSKNNHVRQLFKGESARRRRPTLVNQFRHSVDALMTHLHSREAHFVRCVKPNEAMAPGCLDRDLCMRQLRYLGVKDTVRIRRAGYAVRYPQQEFLRLYSCLLQSPAGKRDCETICRLLPADQWTIGRTKVFLRSEGEAALQIARKSRLTPAAVRLQAAWRGLVTRRHFLRVRRAAVRIQALVRMRLQRRRFARMKEEVRRRRAEMVARRPVPPLKAVADVAPVQISLTIRDRRFGLCQWRVRLPQVLPDSPSPARLRSEVQTRVVEARPALRPPFP